MRKSTVDDIPRIVAMKIDMFSEAGLSHLLSDNAYDTICEDYIELYVNGTASHQLAMSNDNIISMSGAFVKSDLPFRYFKSSIYGYIGDVFTELGFRKQGLARALSLKSIDWLRSKSVDTIRLHASNQAKGLYEGIGFSETSEMKIVLRENL